MVRNPLKPRNLRSILITIILATIPCYLVGLIVLWIGNSIKSQGTVTPTITLTATENPWGGTITSTLPPIPTSPLFPTMTPTLTLTPTRTATYSIPSDTPTLSPTPTHTETSTEIPPPTETETPAVTETTAVP